MCADFVPQHGEETMVDRMRRGESPWAFVRSHTGSKHWHQRTQRADTHSQRLHMIAHLRASKFKIENEATSETIEKCLNNTHSPHTQIENETRSTNNASETTANTPQSWAQNDTNLQTLPISGDTPTKLFFAHAHAERESSKFCLRCACRH